MKYNDYKNYKDLNNLDIDHLKQLRNDIKKELIIVCSQNNAHLGSNLGVLELTISLLKKYPLDQDNIILFDTGHMSYVYKMLTDRKDRFNSIRKHDGISGFQEFSESQYDYFSSGHSGTALSTAIGYSFGNKFKNIIVVIGDMAFFSSTNLANLNYLSKNPLHNLTIIINDNQMGIDQFNSILQQENNINYLAKAFNLKYYGPFDGHNFSELEKAWNIFAKQNKLIHIKSIKGNGLNLTKVQDRYHKINLKTKSNLKKPGYLAIKYISNFFSKEPFYFLNAGMVSSSFLKPFFDQNKSYAIDVDINEENLFLIASGLLLNQNRVLISVYSTFIQRCYDQLIHDIIRNKLNPIILIERAGLAFEDGLSHHGIYDVGMLKSISENIIITQPSSKRELFSLIDLAWKNKQYPFVIRYSNNDLNNESKKMIGEIGEFIPIIDNPDYQKVLITFGDNVWSAKKIIEENKIKINLINCPFLSNHNDKLFIDLFQSDYKKIIFYEDIQNNVGIGSDYLKFLQNKNYDQLIEIYTFKNNHIPHGERKLILEENNMSLYNVLINK